MISAIAWVPKGAAAPNPKRYEMSQAEIEMLQEQAASMENQLSGSDAAEPALGGSGADVSKQTEHGSAFDDLPPCDTDDLPDDLKMDEYEDDVTKHNREQMVGNLIVGKESEVVGTNVGESGVPEERIDDEEEDDDDKEEENGDDGDDGDDSDSDLSVDDFDPMAEDTREYTPINVAGLEAMGLAPKGQPQQYYANDEDEEDSDEEDTNILETDALCLVGTTDEDFSALEVYVYETNTGNLYVHHDIALPAFPISIAWGDINHKGEAGNFAAVGTMNKGIEVWNLDVLDALEPAFVLGGEGEGGALVKGSHEDAVTSLSWNKSHRHVIASGSADKTVKIWDVTSYDSGPSMTFTHHKDKVNCVNWHPTEGTILASGGFDKRVCVADARSADGSSCKSAKLGNCDVESVFWDPYKQERLVAAGEDGTVVCWDVRNMSKKLWTFSGSEYGINDIAFNPNVAGMLATASADKTVTIWDTHSIHSNDPIQIASKEMGGGKLLCLGWYPSSDWLVGCGGTGGQLALWEMGQEDAIVKTFGSRRNGDVSGAVGVEESENAKTGNDIEMEGALPTPPPPPGLTAKSKKSGNKNKASGKKKKAHKKR